MKRNRAMIFTAIATLFALSELFSANTLAGASPQRHAQPSSLREEVIFFDGTTELAGTLFKPADGSPAAALVILTGSDRSARTHLRLAIGEAFAMRGIGALVYDSPGTGRSTGNALLQSRDDRAREAVAAVDYLRGRDDLAACPTGLYGVSEGADITLLAAARDDRLAFIIPVSAGVGGSIFDIMSYAAEKKGYEYGLAPEEIARAITFKEIAYTFLSGRDIVEWPLIETRTARWPGEIWEAFIDITRQRQLPAEQQHQEEILAALRRIVDRVKTEPWFALVEVDGSLQRAVNLPVGAFFTLLEKGAFSTDWERSFCFDARRITCPVLAIWGEQDSFLPPHRSAERLKNFLARGGRSDVSIVIFEDANHTLTLPGEGIEFTPGYFDTMTQWIDSIPRNSKEP